MPTLKSCLHHAFIAQLFHSPQDELEKIGLVMNLGVDLGVD
jgi:hypothetical protein